MAKETFTGPVLVLGGLAGGQQGQQPREYSDEIGPSLYWAGYGIPATAAAVSKDRTGPGTIASLSACVPMRTINAAIQPGGAAATLTAATAPVANTPIAPLSTYATGRAPVTQMFNGVATPAIAIDMQIDSATFATAGTVTLNVAPTVLANIWRYNKPGMWLCLLNSPANSYQFTQVQSIVASTGVINVSPAPLVNGTGTIALTNRFNPNLYGAGAPTALTSEAAAGSARISIPECGNTRGLGIVSVGTGAAGGCQYLIQGISGWGLPQSEIITIPQAAGTTWGKKTYDLFLSCTPLAADGARTSVQVVVSDFIGLPLSVMSINSIASVLYGPLGTQTAQTAYGGSFNFTVIPADTTNPATTSTGDVAGGIQVTGNGPATALGLTPPSAGAITLVGTSFLTIQQQLDPFQVALATGINPGSLLGVPPV
jgi:hypothetical protein